MSATAYRLAPIDDQINAVQRAADRQARYFAKCLEGEQPKLDGRYVALEAYRLKSALLTLQAVKAQGIES